MNVLVAGSGGREHTIIKTLAKSPKAPKLYAFPGNGGIADDAICIPGNVKDLDALKQACLDNKIDFAVIAPDDPLVLGAVDVLNEAGIPCFGPRKNAAIIEGSKIFSKNLMKKYGIPTAKYEVFDKTEPALDFIHTLSCPIVIKADGLALGKGVIIAQSMEEAEDAVRSMMEEKKFGDSGSKIVIEEFLEGPEVSVLAFTDSKTMVPMVSSMDHKRAGDNDTGLNTGGMGTIAPNPAYTPEVADRCMKEIFLPTMDAMNKEGRPFKGCLYFGLMITKDGPKVIEYNCRFGDPETQVVLPLLESDLLEIMMAVENECLSDVSVKFSSGAACCVVMASKGYPEKYETGFVMDIPSDTGAEVFCAGVKLNAEGKKISGGGRVLGITATADSLQNAVNKAYDAVKKISFENAYYRNDIGQKALNILKK